jgi:arsenate reductase-like glutaredoxin family protein
MGKQCNLIRRPMVIRDSQMLVGFDEGARKKPLPEENTKQWG